MTPLPPVVFEGTVTAANKAVGDARSRILKVIGLIRSGRNAATPTTSGFSIGRHLVHSSPSFGVGNPETGNRVIQFFSRNGTALFLSVTIPHDRPYIDALQPDEFAEDLETILHLLDSAKPPEDSRIKEEIESIMSLLLAKHGVSGPLSGFCVTPWSKALASQPLGHHPPIPEDLGIEWASIMSARSDPMRLTCRRIDSSGAISITFRSSFVQVDITGRSAVEVMRDLQRRASPREA